MALFIAFLLALGITLPGCGGGEGFTPPHATQPGRVAVVLALTSSPVSQTVGGKVNAELLQFSVNPSTASEDIDTALFEFSLECTSGATPEMITGLRVIDEQVTVNSGSGVVNPTTSAIMVVPDGAPYRIQRSRGIRNFTVTANISSAAPAGASFRLRLVGLTAFGATTKLPLVIELKQSALSGTTTTVVDAGLGIYFGSSDYRQVTGGASNFPTLTSRFRSMGETETLDLVELALTSGMATSLIQVTLWAGNAQVGSATFTGSSTHASVTLPEGVLLPREIDIPLTVRVDTSFIGINQPGNSGEFVKIAIVDARGTGIDSGSTITATGFVESAGFRTYKSVPQVAIDNLSTTGIADGRLMRVRVQAHPVGDVSAAKFAFRLAPYQCEVTNVNLFCFTDSAYSTVIAGFPNGQLFATNATPTASGLVQIYPQTNTGDWTPMVIPAGQSRYFELRGSVVGSDTNYNIATTILGDSTPLPFTGMSAAFYINQFGGQFIWSPNSFADSSRIGDLDWTDGFGVGGLPEGGFQVIRTN